MKQLLTLLFLSFAALTVSAQEAEVPQNYVLESDNDFQKYEPDAIRCIDWLLLTPCALQPEKHAAVNEFLLKWISGTPAVTVEINSQVVNFMDKNPILLVVYMAGWTRYALADKGNQNLLSGTLKGLEAVMNFYLKNREQLKRDKNVEQYLKLKEQGALENTIAGYLKKQQ